MCVCVRGSINLPIYSYLSHPRPHNPRRGQLPLVPSQNKGSTKDSANFLQSYPSGHRLSICPHAFLPQHIPLSFLSIYLSMYISFHFSIYLSTSSRFLSIFVFLPVYFVVLSISVSFHLSVYLSTHLSIFLSVNPSINLTYYLSIHLIYHLFYLSTRQCT